MGFGGFDFSTGDDEPVGDDLTLIAQQYESQSTPATITLDANKEYTMSGPVQVKNLTIEGAEGSKVKMSSDANFKAIGSLILKNLVIDASALGSKPLIVLDENGSGQMAKDYNLVNDVQIINCTINDVPQIIKDNETKYVIANFLVDNCVVSLNSSATKTVFDMSKNGFFNDLTIKNSTFYSKGIDQDYFVRYSNAGRCDRADFASNSINYENNTFYNVAKTGQWGNYSGFAGRNTSYWRMIKNIFVDCGNGQIARRYLGGRGDQATATFELNTYWFNGAAEDTGNYDNSGTALASDPQFKDAENADFTVQGADQIANKTGDPRWLDTEGISTMVMSEEDVNAPVYNLAGQRVSPTTKGILIKNGKKYINR